MARYSLCQIRAAIQLQAPDLLYPAWSPCDFSRCHAGPASGLCQNFVSVAAQELSLPSENRALQLGILCIAVFPSKAIPTPTVQGSPHRQGTTSNKYINVIALRSISQ